MFNSSSLNSKTIRSSIWKLVIPPKVRLFVWKLCQGILPTRSNLRRRIIQIEGGCLWCAREKETSTHLLFKCISARDVWKE